MRRLLLLALIAATVVPGCIGRRTQPTNFYVLYSLDQPEQRQEQRERPLQGAAIGVGPVQIPKILDRPQIAVKTAPAVLTLAEFDRWGEPLADGITRVLAENLTILVPTDRITVHPFRGTTTFDYQVVLEVTAFGEGPTGEVDLVIRWAILRRGGTKPILVRKSVYRETPASDAYGDTVAAMSRTLIDLSEEIAEALRPLAK